MMRLILVFIFSLFQTAMSYGDQLQSTRTRVGDDAPNFVCQTLSGEAFALKEQKGKVVLINFFATWCGPCLAEMPHLDKQLFQRFKGRDDFELILIGREHDAAELEKFKQEKSLVLPMAPDPKREIYGKYAEKFIPRNFVIGKDGKVKLASVGYSESKFRELVQVIENELKE